MKPFSKRIPARWNPVSLLRRRPPVVAVDVDGLMLRVVHAATRRGRPKVLRFASCQLQFSTDADPNDPVTLGASIAQGLRGLKVNPRTVVMGVPRGLAVLRTLSLPASSNTGELASMVHFQIAKVLPFPSSDAVIDFTVQDTRPGMPAESVADAAKPPADANAAAAPSPPASTPKADVLVAAVKRDVVQFYQTVAEAAGFSLTALGLRSYANARCLQDCNVIPPGEYAALVTLRQDEVIIDVLSEQFLVFSRGASVRQPETPATGEPATPDASATGAAPAVASSSTPAAPTAASPADPAQEGADFIGKVTIEVVRSLHSFESTAQKGHVANVVVAGGTGREQAVVESLANRLSIPCHLLDPAVELGLPEPERADALGALSVFGLGLGANDPEGLPFDFLKPKQPAVAGNYGRVKALAAAAVVAFLVLTLGGLRHHWMQQRVAEYEAAQADVAREKKLRPTYQKMRQQFDSITDWIAQRQNWLDHYAYLSEVFPPSQEIYLTSFTVNGRGGIRMSVQAKNGETIAQLDKQLRAAGYTVKPQAINPASDKYGYPFKSTVEIEIPGKTPFAFPLRAPPPGAKPAATPPATTNKPPAKPAP